MMLFNIILISCLVLIAKAQTNDISPKAINNIINKDDNTLSLVPERINENTNSFTTTVSKSEKAVEFETAHKIPITETEFHTSHKITHERPIIRLLKDNARKTEVNSNLDNNKDDNGIENLMQMQMTQNLLSTKERPELNPILSALINEDVMKSIEAKRAIEREQLKTVSTDAIAQSATTNIPEILLTTTEKSSSSYNDDDGDDENNAGLIDQIINLEEAGSENNQKSRIQIKKAPNGIDYEYEYVYYYYDEDEKNDNKTELSDDSAVKASGQSTATIDKKEQQQRGKSRYTNIDRSTASPAPAENVLVSGKATGRSSIPVTEEVDEGRLPANTRFPPRSKNINLTVTPSLDVSSSAGNGNENEKRKKISVKRPSLELVDSETFNTDEKQVKVNRVNSDAEAKAAAAAEKEEENAAAAAAANAEVSESTSDPDLEHTTPLMEKVAFDLYAILANENFNMDSSTDVLDTDATTDTDTDSTTMVGDYESFATNPTPTTSSTTPEPTTTTTTTTTSTTTTTTTPPPLLSGRRGITNAAGRNRFRLKNGNSASTATTTTVATASEPATPAKGKNRFQRPSFGTRSRYSTTEAAKVQVAEDVVTKDESKPVSLASGRGRTRNRFNLRGYSSTTERSTNENDVEEHVASTTSRSLRARPTLNIRGHSRLGSSSTTEAPSNDNENGESNDEKQSSPSIPTRPSRFNLNRAGVGSNRLLPRGRLNTLRTTTTPVTGAVNESSDSDTAENKNHTDIKDNENNEDGNEKTTGEAATTPSISGLNRLKNRPRIHIQPKTDNNKPKSLPISSVNRKVNPLLARRKLTIGGPSTTEIPHTDENFENHNESEHDQKSDKKEESSLSQTTVDGSLSNNKEKNSDNDTTEPIEVTSEQPRGLGLLGQRRRLPLRKPGTIL